IEETLQGHKLTIHSTVATRVMHEVQHAQVQRGEAPSGRRRGPRQWLRYGLGGSLAAGVAVAALVWMQPRQMLPASVPVADRQAVASSSAPALATVPDMPEAPAMAKQAATVADPLLMRPVGSRYLNV